MEQKEVKTGKMAYYTEGEGAQVLWIHGLCESAEIWQEILPDFPGYKHILVDLPGCGNTEGWDEDAISVDAMAAAVYEVLKAENATAVALVGHSMGGYVGLSLLEKHPQLLRGICLLHSTPVADSEEKKRNRERSIQVFRQNRDLFMREFFRNLFAEDLQDLLRDRWMKLFEQSKKIPGTSVTGTFKALRDRKDRTEALKHFRGSKYFLVGGKDNVLAAADLQKQAAETDSEHILWSDCGHMAFYENPGACAKGIRQFLDSVGE